MQVNIATYEFQKGFFAYVRPAIYNYTPNKAICCSHLPEAPAEVPDNQMRYARNTIMIPFVKSSACAKTVRSVRCYPSLRLVNGALDVQIYSVCQYLSSLIVNTHYTSHDTKVYILKP